MTTLNLCGAIALPALAIATIQASLNPDPPRAGQPFIVSVLSAPRDPISVAFVLDGYAPQYRTIWATSGQVQFDVPQPAPGKGFGVVIQSGASSLTVSGTVP
jgi:hypothetical protein